jgi:hypothetical protein
MPIKNIEARSPAILKDIYYAEGQNPTALPT